MMFLEHWTSSRSCLFSVFSRDDIANIRIKLANEMMFNPRNSGNKTLVISYDLSEVLYSLYSFILFWLVFYVSLYIFLCCRTVALSSYCWSVFFFSFAFVGWSCVRSLYSYSWCLWIFDMPFIYRLVLKDVVYNMLVLCCTSLN